MLVSSCWIILLGLHALVAFEKPVIDGHHDPDLYEDLLSLSIAEYNKISKDNYRWIPVEILDINGIYNTGVHFSIRIAIALSNCTKVVRFTPTLTINIAQQKKQPACVFEIFRPTWRKSAKTKLLTCSNYDSSEELIETSSRASDASVAVDMKSQESTTNVSQEWLEPKTLMLWNNFLNFVNKFKTSYSSKIEKLNRFKIYMQNMHFAQKLQYEEKGTAIYGETQFSDMMPEEFRKIMLPNLWWQSVESNRKNPNIDFDLEKFNLSLNNLPRSFDWREKGVVTPVKNQGSCGSCWAFSVTGNIESLWAIKKGDLISLSEQELIDCDVVDKGCNGGLPINAFREIIRMGGLEPEDQYPYKAKNGTCHLVRTEIAVSIDDAVEIPRNETIMQAWIAQRGPLSVGIDAELLAYYKSGILHPSRKRCPPSKINHGVLITGYGIEDDLPYWTIKNSWSQQWGENGYFRLRRGRDVCGVSDLVSSAIIN
ncbi:papain family cysteine protease [Onchocerca flexuosa]|uniref:Papain family cysteine protease n=1 Tax=Onchocerca flexuosa TaxID=387005 RepID=A0A238BRJ4_9BILA|nr:papain family cysteine protease [Onchocerca flexuosa]